MRDDEWDHEITPTRLEAIRERLSKCSPAPWFPGCFGKPGRCQCRYIFDLGYAGAIGEIYVWNGIDRIADGNNDCPKHDEALGNLRFITAARQDVQDLVAYVERLEAQVAYVEPAEDELEATVEDINTKAEILDLTKVVAGAKIHVQTKNTLYLVERRHDDFFISGNLTYCPKPEFCYRLGSGYWYGDMNENLLRVGDHMRFVLRGEGPIITTPIQSIEVVDA